ncbi:hypothetical protein tinsulaeT_00420 [Thalassotalea insulae]|uniref:DUF4279 domain-containing protein n=1 Tax=Thalassotalea insulae TaxID=2056778 RepID=A0ABQ6GMV3_9GAMM|nr:hypothetical protein [Thalassotalea insulae]GLX76702.1 hypothetical protein tinsulaeT_00420 [Thalassotalea insulae]
MGRLKLGWRSFFAIIAKHLYAPYYGVSCNKEIQHLNLATLTIRGSKEELEIAKSKIPLTPYRSWSLGDAITNSKTYDDFGYEYEIADTDTPAGLTQKIEAFLNQLHEQSINFNKLGVSAELSLGIGVGDEVQYIASHQFSLNIIELLVKTGLSLEYSAYPVGEE